MLKCLVHGIPRMYDGVMDSSSDYWIGEPFSNSNRVHYIHLHVNNIITFSKGYGNKRCPLRSRAYNINKGSSGRVQYLLSFVVLALNLEESILFTGFHIRSTAQLWLNSRDWSLKPWLETGLGERRLWIQTCLQRVGVYQTVLHLKKPLLLWLQSIWWPLDPRTGVTWFVITSIRH